MRTRSFRQNNSWIHTWAGLLLGWLLYAVFLTGTISFFHEELTLWMTPERHASQVNPQTPLKAVERLHELAPDAAQWNISLPGERGTSLEIQWFKQGERPGRGAGTSMTLDATTGETITPRETRGGAFLYRFHFELTGMPRMWGRWIVGIATMFMLVALISGVVIHKKIFKDFFTFRPAKEQRSWLDFHCASSVLALPFHLMITYSGLVLLMFVLMPWGAQSVYEGNMQQYFSEIRGGGGGGQNTAGREGSGREGGGRSEPTPAALTDLQPILEQAGQRWERGIASINISQPGTDKAVIELRERGATSLIDRGASKRLRFNGVTGELLATPPAQEISGAMATYNVLNSLHMLHFAGSEVRWLFFFSGLLGTLMIATGLIFWSAKRLTRDPRHFGHKLVECLNVASIVGLPIAIAVYLWANRLLPVGMEGRSEQEIEYFLIAWAVCLVHPFLRGYRQAWIEQLTVAAVLFAALPLFSFSLPDSHLLITLWKGNWIVASTDLCLLAFAAVFGVASWKLIQRRQAVQEKLKVAPRVFKAAAPSSEVVQESTP